MAHNGGRQNQLMNTHPASPIEKEIPSIPRKLKLFPLFLLLFFSNSLHFSTLPSDVQYLSSTATNSMQFKPIGQVGGPTQAVAIKDGYDG